ncbi:uncharacterized protein LOC124448676 [Xenia sp. Carnegie-2017]|uniref:uncharacterized protein LOC124448676 n=1 Tax=Xenia sp. Carnegie-2017 TaxID=2897299 RepID=UPI001F03B004|nr:uncharacterized protein LOC124448676 [Xenia sp. Carnegie-2017]
MNSKIDLSCVPDSLNENLSHVTLNNNSLSSVESPAIVSALLGHSSKDSKESSLDLPEKSTSSFYETASPFFSALLNKESVHREIFYSDDIAEDSPTPSSPEQHVPNVEWKLKSQLDAYLNLVQIISKEDHVYVDHADDEVFNDDSVNIANGIETNKSCDPVKHGLKSKVKTPEQKQRKRLQNRTAATRYRSKKRSEQETLNAKVSELEEENIKLQQVIESRKQEISFLKNLVVDVLMRKADYIKFTNSTIK